MGHFEATVLRGDGLCRNMFTEDFCWKHRPETVLPVTGAVQVGFTVFRQQVGRIPTVKVPRQLYRGGFRQPSTSRQLPQDDLPIG